MCDMTYLYVPWLMCDMTYLYVPLLTTHLYVTCIHVYTNIATLDSSTHEYKCIKPRLICMCHDVRLIYICHLFMCIWVEGLCIHVHINTNAESHDVFVWHNSFRGGSFVRSYMEWLIHMWHATFTCGWLTHSPYSRVPWLIRIKHVGLCAKYAVNFFGMWRDSFICDTQHPHVPRLIYIIRDMLPLYMCYDFCTCALPHTEEMRLWDSMWNDMFMRDMQHSHVSRLMCISYVTRFNYKCHDSFICAMTHY